MFEAPYEKDKATDSILPKLISTIREKRVKTDDDYTLFVCGARGTGKSMLGLHMSEQYMGENASVDFIGLNPSDFARALKKATSSPKPRMCNNDEANMSKRDFQSKYNKDLLDTYYSIRGLNIFHIWNNPSLDIIDKKFIEDIVNGVIYVFSKEKNKPRLYYFFTKMAILTLFEKEECLSLKVLKKYANKYAMYRGWFRDYNGVLKQPYLEKKGSRMEEKVDSFFDKYAKEENPFLKMNALVSICGLTSMTLKKYIRLLIEKGSIKEEDIKKDINGISSYNPRIIPILKQFIEEKIKYNKSIDSFAWRKNENSVLA